MYMYPAPVAVFVALAAALVPGARGDRVTEAATTWKTVTTAHFVVRTDAPAGAYGPLLERLEDVHEALRTTLFDGLPLAPVQVLLFARQRDFQAVAPADLVGFYTTDLPGFEQPLGDGLLVFSAEGDFQLSAATAAHELAHHFMQALSDHVPTWLHEGFAKYVGALQLDEASGRLAFDRAPVSDHWAHASAPVPLPRLFASDTTDFHGASARAQYLTAWLLVRELLANPGPGSAAARFQELVVRSVLAHGPAAQAAVVSGLSGRPIAELEARVRAAHEAARAGVTSAARDTLAVTLTRMNRNQPQEVPADGAGIAFIDSLRALLAAQARGH
jgi:hypothetical protein